MPNTPLNPDALEAMSREIDPDWWQIIERFPDDLLAPKYREIAISKAERFIRAYLAVAQPVVSSVESLPAKMRMLAWEGGEIEIGEIPEGHVLVGFEMATDRAWSMADKVTIHIERPEVKP